MNSNHDPPIDLPGELIRGMEAQFPWLVDSPDDGSDEADLPEWLENVIGHIFKSISPNFESFFEDEEKEITPEEAGEMMGLVYSFMTTAGTLVEKSDELGTSPSGQFVKAIAALSTGNPSDPLAGFKPIVEKTRELTGAQLKEMTAKDPAQLYDFSEAFTSSGKKGFISDDGTRLVSETEATQIYLLLLVFGQIWQEKLQSLDELHRLLCHCFGANVVGEFGRLRKLCNRVKYSIGKRGHSPKRKRDIDEISLSVLEGLREAQARPDD